jgi:putative FmdB family regulatory protein
MPTYQYQCACGYREEIRHGMNEDVVIECTVCKVPMTRKPFVSAVQFVGTGFVSNERN